MSSLGLEEDMIGGLKSALLAGGLLACLVEGLGFGPRPKRVASWVDPKGVAVSQPDDQGAPKTLV